MAKKTRKSRLAEKFNPKQRSAGGGGKTETVVREAVEHLSAEATMSEEELAADALGVTDSLQDAGKPRTSDTFLLDDSEIHVISFCRRVIRQVDILRGSGSWHAITPKNRAILCGAQAFASELIGETDGPHVGHYTSVRAALGDGFPSKILGVFKDKSNLALRVVKLDEGKLAEILAGVE